MLACACGSNEGQRYVETDELDGYATGLLDELRFAAAAHLYTGEADVERIAGIAAKSRDFQLAVTKRKNPGSSTSKRRAAAARWRWLCPIE